MSGTRLVPSPATKPRSVTATLAWAGIGVLVAALWLTQRHWPGALMEEGMMLALPLRVLHGAVPYHSFAFFYGPLSLWLPAGLYSLFGASLAVERALGAAYLLVVGWSLYLIGRRWSTGIGLAMAIPAVLVAQFAGVGLSALPETGGLGFCLLGIAAGTAPRGDRRADLSAGLCFAIAADLRPDCLAWGGLVLLALVLTGRRGVVSLIALAAGLFPYLIAVLTAGLGNVWRSVVVDALRLPAERHLSLLGAGAVVVLVAGLLAAVTIAVLCASVRRWREPRWLALALVTALAWFSVPEFLQRADLHHLASPASVIIGCAAAAFLAMLKEPRRPVALGLGALGVSLTVLVLLSFVTDLALPNYRLQLAGVPTSYAVTNHGRTWYYDSGDEAHDVARIVRVADRLAAPNRNLLVGTQDLSETTYVDDSLYFLLPQFGQRGHFYDFHPGIALHYGHQLAADVAAAKILILLRVTTNEPNSSRQHGAQLANQVVRRDFRLISTAGDYAIYARRPQADARLPSPSRSAEHPGTRRPSTVSGASAAPVEPESRTPVGS